MLTFSRGEVVGRGNHLGIRASNLGNLSKIAQNCLEEKIEANEVDLGSRSGDSEVAKNGRNNGTLAKSIE